MKSASRLGEADGRTPRAAYQLAQRVDNLSLRLLDLGVVLVAWLLAFLAGYEASVPWGATIHVVWFLGIPVVVQCLLNERAGLYGPVWRYASVEEAVRVVVAVFAGSLAAGVLLAIGSYAFDVPLPLLTTPPVAALLVLLGCGGIRFQSRLFALERQRSQEPGGVRALIVGAGNAGATLAYELSNTSAGEGVRVVGFVDDDPGLAGRSVRGLPVLGTTDDLADLTARMHADRILIALPDSAADHTKAIVERALRTEAQVKVLPLAADLVGGPLLRSVRDLDVTDLLGREHAPVDSLEIADYLAGATVLVTGAGGSIGSEIARQVARYAPGRLLLLDRDESLLHDTVIGALGDAEPLLVDIRDRPRLRAIFDKYRPDVVFHAAAHKHVPMLESHPVEAVRTNVLGTWWLAETAAEFGCGRFVHISTDKAADPCSVMGATKRAAEQVVFEVGRRHDLPYVAVRFGNVLGSRGSVVPTFLRQILDGGPVTVTSPEMTRYFMTIPEAVSLVLQSGAMAEEGKIFLLDMGEPVSILGLARQMIRLSGLRPDDDIEIVITGARPGERLHERLVDDAEDVEPAGHPSISALAPKAEWDWAELQGYLDAMDTACDDAADLPVVTLLEEMLSRSGVESKLVERREEAAAARADRGTTVAVNGFGAGAPAVGTSVGSRRTDDTERNGNGEGHGDEAPAGDGAVTMGGSPRGRWSGLAVLGGPPRFTPGLPFARPARPPYAKVTARMAPSYERGMLTNGALVRELEERVAERLGVPHVVAVSSCTSGLMLTVQALVEDRPGPVVLPSFTFSASGHGVAWNGRACRFVEVDPASFQLDLEHTAEALDGASLIMATHVFGAPCGPGQVEALARRAGVPVLFDAAHGLGATCGGRAIGSFGVAEVFSLTPTKVLVAGEGGLVATADAALAERLRIGRDYGNPGDYDTRFVGLNARMSEFHAALALESLEILDSSLRRRRQLAAHYRRGLDEVPGLSYQAIDLADESTFKDFTIRVDADEFGLTRDELVLTLAADGIDTRSYFDPPVHRQQAYADQPPVDLPITDATSANVVSLPIYPDLTDDQVEHVIDTLRAAHAHATEIEAELRTSERIGPQRTYLSRAAVR